VDDAMKDNHPSPLWKIDATPALNLIGRCDDSNIDSDWNFDVNFKYTIKAKTVDIPGTKGGLNMGVEVAATGKKKVAMKSLIPEKKDKLEKKILEYDELNFYTDDKPNQKLVIMHEEENKNLEKSAEFVNAASRDGKATDVTLGLRNMGLR
jgi:hypothetical protein